MHRHDQFADVIEALENSGDIRVGAKLSVEPGGGFRCKGMPIARFKREPGALFDFAFCLRKRKPFGEGHW